MCFHFLFSFFVLKSLPTYSFVIFSNCFNILQVRNVSTLTETAIYVATVDKYSDVLKSILEWVARNSDQAGEMKMENADCILHASLEDDKEQVNIKTRTSLDFNYVKPWLDLVKL